MVDTQTVLDSLRKAHGDRSIIQGSFLKPDFPRIPSGVFSIDYCTGGGFPVWHSSCMWGAESGGKTSTAAGSIERAQNLCWRCFNDVSLCSCSLPSILQKVAFVNIENSYDPLWFSQIGVNTDELLVVEADSGEDYVDIINYLIQADDVGLIVVDSLSELSPMAEAEKSASDDFYALQARLIGRFMRVSKNLLIKEKKRDHKISLLHIAQMRTKIGVMFGSSDTMSGGWGMKHEFALLLQMNRKALTEADKKRFNVSESDHNRANRFSFHIRKEKVFTVGSSGEFVRVRENFPDLGLSIGGVDDINSILNYAKEYDIISKNGAQWKYFDKTAKTQGQIKELLQKSATQKKRTIHEIIARAKHRILEERDA